jgi:hypothetical protein
VCLKWRETNKNGRFFLYFSSVKDFLFLFYVRNCRLNICAHIERSNKTRIWSKETVQQEILGDIYITMSRSSWKSLASWRVVCVVVLDIFFLRFPLEMRFVCFVYWNSIFCCCCYIVFCQCIYGCYVHSAILPTFHRRCYWLLQVITFCTCHCRSIEIECCLSNSEQNPDIVLVHYLNVPYPDDAKLLVVASVSLWAERKEWSKDELISQLRPMCKKSNLLFYFFF